MSELSCPRCTSRLTYRAFEAEGGYRSNVTMRELHECAACRLAVVGGANVVEDERAPPVPLRRTLLVRETLPSKWPCPACATPLAKLMLAWGSSAIGIESCERCDLVVLDRGELEVVEEMLDESSALQVADLETVDGRVSDVPEARGLERPLRRFLRAIRLL